MNPNTFSHKPSLPSERSKRGGQIDCYDIPLQSPDTHSIAPATTLLVEMRKASLLGTELQDFAAHWLHHT